MMPVSDEISLAYLLRFNAINALRRAAMRYASLAP